MAEEVVVEHGRDGKITVCIGDRCVTVSCAGDEKPDEQRRRGRSMIVVERLTDVLGDVETFDWEAIEPGVEIARTDDTWLERRPLD